VDQSRRKFFGIGAAVAAASAIPAGAMVAEKSAREAVGPILLERTCDNGRGEMTAENVAAMDRSLIEEYGEVPAWHRGCGIKFQWYLNGGYPMCPNCGRAYQMTLEMLKSGKYTVKS